MSNDPIPVYYNGNKFYGFKKCPLWLKRKLKETSSYTCEDCGVKESRGNILEIHRPKRGCDGGLYVCVPRNHPLSNCRILCKKCHKNYDYSPKFGSY